MIDREGTRLFIKSRLEYYFGNVDNIENCADEIVDLLLLEKEAHSFGLIENHEQLELLKNFRWDC